MKFVVFFTQGRGKVGSADKAPIRCGYANGRFERKSLLSWGQNPIVTFSWKTG